MTAAINEACIELLHENYYLVRGIFLVLEMSIFLLLVGILPTSPLPILQGFPPNAMFGGRDREVHI